MNLLSASIKCTSIGFLVGFVASTGHDLDKDILPLAWMLVFISMILVLRGMAYMEPQGLSLQQRPVVRSITAIGLEDG